MEKSHVSMEQKLCPICGKIEDSGVILLDQSLKASMERNTVTGYKHCKDCKEKLDNGFLAFVEISNERISSTIKNENALRTGVIGWIKRSVAENIFNISVQPMNFISVGVLQQLKPNE